MSTFNNDNNDNNENNNTLIPCAEAQDKENLPKEIKEVFNAFHLKGILQNYANKTHRKCAEDMIKKFGVEKTVALANFAVSILGQPYSPTINNPYELKQKLGSLMAIIKKQKQNKSNYIKL